MKNWYALCFLMVVCLHAHAQDRADSLLNVYSTGDAKQQQSASNAFASDVTKMEPERLKLYAAKWMEKGEQLNDPLAKATAMVCYGNYYYAKGDFGVAEPYFKDNLSIRKQLDDKHNLSQAYNLLGNVYQAQANFHAAVECHLNALKLREELKNEKGVGASYNNLANAYRGLSQFDKSLEYHKLSLGIKERMKDERGMGFALANIANTYWELKDINNAYLHYKKALQVQMRLNDGKMIATTYNSLGYVSKELGRYDEAMVYLKKSLAYRIKADDKDALATSYLNMGDLYRKMKDNKNAQLYLNKGLELGNVIGDKGLILDIKKAMAAIAQDEQDYEKTIKLLKDAERVKDSIFKVEGLRSVAEMQAKYETEKKEAAIRLLEKENELMEVRNKQQLYVAFSLVVLMLVGTVAYYSFQKARQQKQRATELLEIEKARLNAVIQTQEHERKRISADLHDGIGPVLSALKINLSMVEPGIENVDRYNIAMQLVDKSYKELRQISHTMMPAMLAKTGLAQTLHELAVNLTQPGKLTIRCYADEDELRYSEQVEINVYRIVQELLNNIVKYANATQVTIQLYQEPSELSLMIEDDGDGYDVALLNRSKGNGWANIQSRLSLLDGSIELDSMPAKKGSNVHIVVPAHSVSKAKIGIVNV
jgi:signal transduction histidine kinase